MHIIAQSINLGPPSYLAKYSYEVLLFGKVDWGRNKK